MPIILSYVSADALIPVAFQQLMVSDTVVAITIPDGVEPVRLLLSIHTNAVRLRWDGGEPTPTLGHQLTAGSGPAADVSRGFELIGGAAIRRLRMCRDGTSDAEVAYTLEQ